MSEEMLTKRCADGKKRSFNTSDKACSKFTHFKSGEVVGTDKGDIMILGVAPTVCPDCRMRGCDKRKMPAPQLCGLPL